ncbi:MAG: hydantoinase/oxoprolinase family protein [Chloroflexi bacterium]|nr:hydantoinase/oxoprolinase family protein [Chloroflexota bacterium]
MSYTIGIDIGGTFTDCYIIDDKGAVAYDKAPSTPQDFSIGVSEAVKATAEWLDKSLPELLRETSLFVHSCTVATNALINYSGAKTGLITTMGFEDIILIMRAWGRIAGLSDTEIAHVARTNKPEPIVPKRLIKGVRERVDFRGRVIAPLFREDVVKAVQELVSEGVESIAVSLLWSFANPSHEQQIREIVKDLNPDIPVTISSEISPLLGEYERTATAAINSYLMPVVSSYFDALEHSLKSNGLRHPPLIMQAYGGSLPIATARTQAVTTIAAGPAGGVLASQYLAETLGYKNVITSDVGGTSFDVGLIYDGHAEMTPDLIVNQYVIQTPRIQVESIGAGGGSIAWLEPVSGLLRVGPKSAGAVPGPVCYDRGGTEPTVTDADVVLGYIDPDYFLGGRIKLNARKAYEALEKRIARRLGITPEEAAAAIYDIINARMAGLLRKMTIEKGYDPRACVLFAFGGAGPAHAGIYAEELGIKDMVVPITAAVQCAMGAALSDVVHTYMVSERVPVETALSTVNSRLAELEAMARRDLTADGFEAKDIALRRYVGMSYRLQVHDLLVPAPAGPVTKEDLHQLTNEFERVYERTYGQGAGQRSAGIQVTCLKVEGIGKIYKPVMAKRPLGEPNASKAVKGRRPAFFRRLNKFTDTDVYDMARLQPGNTISGPAIIETTVTTIVIHPGQEARVDGYLNVLMKTNAAG